MTEQLKTIINVLRYFNIEFDEGAGFDDSDPRNAYGPYFQRQRVEIYTFICQEPCRKEDLLTHAFVQRKSLIR